MDSDSSTASESDSDDELPSWVAPVLLLLVDQQQGSCARSNNRSRIGQTFLNDLLNCGNPLEDLAKSHDRSGHER